MAEENFTVEPKETPYFANGGDTGLILDCQVKYEYSQEPYKLQWLKIVKGAPRVISIGEQNHFPNQYALEMDKSGQYNLRILKVEYGEDNGRFFCQISGPEGIRDSRPANVIVLLPPGTPRIVDQPSEPIQEGAGIVTKCESVGGNPPPNVSWRFSNGTEINSDWVTQTNATSLDLPTTSVLRFNANPSHDDLSVQCQVSNKAMEDESPLEVSSRRFSIRYKPQVSVGPTAIYNVEKGQQAMLSCNAKANPPAGSYNWVQSDGTGSVNFRQPNVTFTVTRESQGTYTCFAGNDMGQGSDSLKVNVFYGPQILLQDEILVSEGGPLRIQCDVDSNPVASLVQWDGPAGSQEGQTLDIPNITREHAGNYTCSAKNEITVYSNPTPVTRSAVKNILVKVAYKPSEAMIEISGEPVAVGETVTLTCSAEDPGEPRAQYRWSTPGMGNEFIYNSQSTYTINNVQLTHAGEYACVAYNTAGEGPKGLLNLRVFEPARLFQFLESSAEWTQEDPSKSLSCAARGNPAPAITWMLDGKDLNPQLLKSHWSIHDTPSLTNCPDPQRCSFEVTSTLTWRDRVRWTDKGVFTCRAWNGAGEPVDSNLTLRVRHSAVILGDRNQAFAAADTGNQAVITCRASARPPPEFRWYFAGQEIALQGGGRYTSDVQSNDAQDEFYHSLIIASATENDFGEYLCKSTNVLGTDSLVFKLQRKAPPLSPSNLRHLLVESSWIELGWDAGFDGGSPQMFGVEMLTLDPINLNPVGPPDFRNTTDPGLLMYSAGFSHNRRFKRYSPGVKPVTMNITGLSPLSSYRFRLRAWNELGSTKWSDRVSITTKDSTVDENIPKPMEVQYNSAQGTLKFKPPQDPRRYCIGVYAQQRSEPRQWRRIGCMEPNGKVNNLPNVAAIKTRYCNRDTMKCSEASPALMTSAVAGPVPWMVVGPVLGVLAFLLVLALLIGLACCVRKRKPKGNKQNNIKNNVHNANKDYEMETNQARPKVSAPYTNPNVNNGNTKIDHEHGTTVMAGSQADSGVFTLGSQYGQPSFDPNGAYDPIGQIGQSANGGGYTNGAMSRASYDDANDRWANANDPYGDMIDPYGNVTPFSAVDGGFDGQNYQQNNTGEPEANAFGYYDPYGNPNGVVDMNPRGQPQGQGSQDESLNSGYSTPNQRRVIREIIV